MQLNIAKEVAALRRLSTRDLRARYAETFGEATNANNKVWLVKRIAWRLQALTEGDLSERARGRAHEIARDADLRIVAPRDFFSVDGERVQTTDRNRRQQDPRLPLPGALLSRKWKGRTILVEVLAKGFRCENRQYSSLSAIAVAITGTRWNGLAFFGLTRSAIPARKERSHAKK